jgi:hypothetical protein
MYDSDSRPLFYEELSYQIRGILMAVHGDVRPGFREESYQVAMKKGLAQKKISFVAKPATEDISFTREKKSPSFSRIL